MRDIMRKNNQFKVYGYMTKCDKIYCPKCAKKLNEVRGSEKLFEDNYDLKCDKCKSELGGDDDEDMEYVYDEACCG